MYRNGHYGGALLVYAPVGAIVFGLGYPTLAALGGAIAVGGAMLPDLDQRVPLIAHRGITHTLWFALLAGGVLGGLGVFVGLEQGPTAAARLGGFGAVVGVVTIGAHVLADALTPMGVRPFAPLSRRKYTLGLVRADNTIANYTLFALGVAAAALAFVGGNALAAFL